MVDERPPDRCALIPASPSSGSASVIIGVVEASLNDDATVSWMMPATGPESRQGLQPDKTVPDQHILPTVPVDVQSSQTVDPFLERLAGLVSNTAFVPPLFETLVSTWMRHPSQETLRFMAKTLSKFATATALTDTWILSVDDTSSLLVINRTTGLRQDTPVHILTSSGLRRPTGKPVILEGSARAVWLVDIGAVDLRQALAVAWSPNGGHRIRVDKALHGSEKKLSDVILATDGTERNKASRWLKEKLSAAAKQSRRLQRALRRIDSDQIGDSTPTVAFGESCQTGIAAALRATNGQMAVFGWTNDPHQLIDKIAWIGTGERRVPLANHLFSSPHRGIPKPAETGGRSKDHRGFIAFLKTPSTAVPLGTESFEITLHNGESSVLTVKPAAHRVGAARDLALTLPNDPSAMLDLLDGGLGSVVGALHADALAGTRLDHETVLGTPNTSPRASVVIPLYGTTAFLRAQYTAFALGADASLDEFIFVVDDPALSDIVVSHLRALHALYGLPCRVLHHGRNLGYAPAVNTGVATGSAPWAVLLNSDVVPITPTPVTALIRAAKRRKAAAVGPKLLFANGTIQHAGLTFSRHLDGMPFNRSLSKGYPSDDPRANRPSEPEALTGACLLVDRQAWDDVGGLSEDYVIGDFEDTDLCLSLRRAGYRLHYEPSVSLHHYERQSIDLHTMHRVSMAERYNQWLHARRWFPDVDHLPAGRSASRGSKRRER